LIAHSAVKRGPRNAWAHSVLAVTYNPQYRQWERADADSAWVHLLKSVECDPAEASAWLTIWSEAMRRGDTAREEQSLRALADSGFLTPCVLAHARWMLADLPPDAVLLVGGDMDTYPPLALQLIDGFRTDVVIINLSMLNLQWYATLLCDRHDLPFPYPREEMPEIDYKWEDDEFITVSKQFVQAWLRQYSRSEFPRPIAVSMTVADYEFWNDGQNHLMMSGPYRFVHREASDVEIDVEACHQSLETVSELDLSGPFVGEVDRSPIRRMGSPHLATNPGSVAILLAQWYMAEERPTDAIALLDWAEQFEKNTEVGFVHESTVVELRQDAWKLMD
jgi:hypothetical protein